MKLLYHLASTAVPGGSVRVLYNKIRWLTEKGGYEIVVVTTDQKGAPSFFPYPQEIKCIDLGINYWDDYSKNPLSRFFITRRKRQLHRKMLAEILSQEKPDITIAHYPTEAWVAGTINDRSKKIMEFHTSRNHRLSSSVKGIRRFVALFLTMQDKKRAKLFDRFVVLTEEDARQWGKMSNLCVIANSVKETVLNANVIDSHLVIAAGRLIPLKGFDLLIDAWAKLPSKLLESWKLRVYGNGQLESYLKERILQLGIQDSASILHTSKQIFKEYANSAFLVMTSEYEGLPMVMIEAMSVGLPVVSFDFKCGPRDIIEDGKNGLIVKLGDRQALSEAMAALMSDAQLRMELSRNAKSSSEAFSETVIMKQWIQLFDEILKDN